MKKIIFSAICLFTNHAYAQDLDGIYSGKIFSEKNVFKLATTGSTAIGSIHLNRTEKIVFLGSVDNSRLVGSFQLDNSTWNVSGELQKDTLLLVLRNGDKNTSVKLKKVSQNISYNFNKLLNATSVLDVRLVGSWKFVIAIKADGSKAPSNEVSRGFMYHFNLNGSCKISSPALDKLYGKNKAAIPRSSWETIGSKLVTTTGDSRPMRTESYYELKGDTLITIYKSTRSYYIRTSK